MGLTTFQNMYRDIKKDKTFLYQQEYFMLLTYLRLFYNKEFLPEPIWLLERSYYGMYF